MGWASALQLACAALIAGYIGFEIANRPRRPKQNRLHPRRRGPLPPPSSACRRDWQEFTGR